MCISLVETELTAHEGTRMRSIHLLISGRGAFVFVLIALFVVLGKGRPSNWPEESGNAAATVLKKHSPEK
jgi:hypothetical protein